MRAYWTLVQREIGSHFLSWSGYSAIAGVVFLLGLSFVSIMESLNNEATTRPITELFCSSIFFWLILLLASPVITMRSFAQEKALGTFETLMTTPVHDSSVVLAKFTGAMIIYTLMWLPLFACLWVMRHFAKSSLMIEGSTLASTLLGIFLIGMVFMSMGCLASSLTRSQMVAAVMTFCGGTAMVLLSVIASNFSGMPGIPGQLVAQLSVVEQMEDFGAGVVDTRPLVLYLSLTFFFLFFTWRALEGRRWK